MEHLDDPEAALEIVARLARPWAIVSVPREPLWRALNLGRLKYVRGARATPRAIFSTGRGARSSRFLEAAPGGGRRPQPGPLDHGSVPERSEPARAVRARAGLLADRLAGHRLGAGDALDGLGAAIQLRPGSGARRRAGARSTAGTGRPRTRRGSRATSTPSRRPGWRRSPFPRIWRSTPPAPGRSPGMRPPTPARRSTPGGRRPSYPDLSEYAYSPQRAHRVEVRVENAAPIDLGADPGGGGDPGGRAACCSFAGSRSGSSRATAPRRRSRSGWGRS